MAKKKRVKKPDDYTIAQLQQLLDSKLKSKRDELQKQLDELDQLISKTEGVSKKRGGYRKKKARGASSSVGAPARRKKKVSRKGRRRRARNERSAKSYAEEILQNESKGLPLDELADRILAQGYKSNSTSFKNTLYQSLYNARRAGKTFDYNEKTGRWVLR